MPRISNKRPGCLGNKCLKGAAANTLSTGALRELEVDNTIGGDDVTDVHKACIAQGIVDIVILSLGC